MSLRYSCATVGRQARIILTRPSLHTSSPRALNLALAKTSNINSKSHSYRQTQQRLSSTSTTPIILTPPWQFEDMPANERRAFERWGPDYYNHMTPAQQEHALKVAAKRAQLAEQLEHDFGSDWYAIMKDASAMKDRHEDAEVANLKETPEYQDADRKGKKAIELDYFRQRNATKTQRLRELMRTVVRNRGQL